jgi:hypothetical protein
MDLRSIIAAIRNLDESTSRSPAPTLAELERAPLISGWIMSIHPDDAPPSLFGIVVNHPLIADVKTAVTSELVAMSRVGAWARTHSRYYRLGRAVGEER